MKNLVKIYAIFIGILLLVGLLGISYLQRSSISSALNKLGKTPALFSEARALLLLGTENPTKELVAFASNKSKKQKARIDALKILADYASRQPIEIDSLRCGKLLSDTTTAVRHAVLNMLEKAGAANGLMAVTKILKETGDTGVFQQCFRILYAMPNGTSDLLTQISYVDSTRLDSILKRLDSVPVWKGKFYPDVARYFSLKGNYKRAAHYAGKTAFINTWWVLGSYENLRMSAFLKELPPEKKPFNPTDTFVLETGEKATWIPINKLVTEPWGMWLNLLQLFVRNLNSAAFAATYIHSPTQRDVFLFLGSDDGFRVYVNDTLVHSKKVYRGCFADDDLVRIHLHKGVNTLLVKVLQDVGGWGLAARLSDFNGEYLSDLVISLSDTATVSNKQTTAQELISKGKDEWPTIITTNSLSQDELPKNLLKEALSDSNTQSIRMNAFLALAYVNSLRIAPYGEEPLVAWCLKECTNQLSPPLLSAGLSVLVQMQSRLGGELGLAASKSLNTEVCYLGNRLLSIVNREHVIDAQWNPQTGFSKEVFDKLQSGATKITDPWIIERMASYYALKKDTTNEKSCLSAIAMPKKWISYSVTTTGQDEVELLKSRIPNVSIENAFGRPPKIDKKFDAVTFEIPGSKYGITPPWFDFGNIPQPCPDNDKASALYTTVNSTVADTAYVGVTLGVGFHLIFNGLDVGKNSASSGISYKMGARYPSQPRVFDVATFPIYIKKGMNTLCITATGFCFDWQVSYVRVGFYNKFGEPIGCKDQTLLWGGNR